MSRRRKKEMSKKKERNELKKKEMSRRRKKKRKERKEEGNYRKVIGIKKLQETLRSVLVIMVMAYGSRAYICSILIVSRASIHRDII